MAYSKESCHLHKKKDWIFNCGETNVYAIYLIAVGYNFVGGTKELDPKDV